MKKHLICLEDAMAAMKRLEAEDLEEFGVRLPETFNAKRACEALLGLRWRKAAPTPHGRLIDYENLLATCQNVFDRENGNVSWNKAIHIIKTEPFVMDRETGQEENMKSIIDMKRELTGETPSQGSSMHPPEEAKEVKGELELAAEGVSTALLEWLMSRATKDKVEVCIETTPEVQTITVRPFEPIRYGCPFQGTCERSAE